MSGALLADLYEFTMAASYLRRGMYDEATFSLFVRQLPRSRGFLVAAGVFDCLDWLTRFRLEEGDLEYLSGAGFSDDTLSDFADLRFTGDVWAVPEGRIVFAGEPLLEVTAPIAEAQIVETFLVNQITSQTLIASKAARCRLAVPDRIQLVDSGMRRSHGVDAGLALARLTAMVGFSATSNTEAARRFGLRCVGTMGHAYIEAFPCERAAFRAFAEDFPTRASFVVDTFDTMRGVENAIAVIREFALEDGAGIRLDSGDLVGLSRSARRALDVAGLPRVRIFVTGGLDEYELERLVAEGAPIDGAGLGTRVGVSADAPYLDAAYKIVEYAGRGVAKQSPGKATLPGAKQIFRRSRLEDVVGLRSEPVPLASEPLLVPVMCGGVVVPKMGGRSESSVERSWREARKRFDADLAELPDSARALVAPRPPEVGLTPALSALAEEVKRTADPGATMPG